MKISFATTCMGRLHHLQQTLPDNIRNNPSRPGLEVEFVVLNYNSKDGMDDWIRNDPFCLEQIEKNVLRYAHYKDSDTFRMSHAKNMAHRMATGDVICNLDADNFTGPGFAEYIAGIFEAEKDTILSPSFRTLSRLDTDKTGCFGRIALTRENFIKLGGYDEKFVGWGGEDSDLRRRAKGLGLHQAQFGELEFCEVIPHPNADRVINSYEEQDREKAAKKVESILNGRSFKDKLSVTFNALVTPVQANNGISFGEGEIIRGLERIPDVLGKVANQKLPSVWISAFGAMEMLKGRLTPNIIPSSSPSTRAFGNAQNPA